MEILIFIGIIVGILTIFIGGGILGWVLKVIGMIFSFLWDGCLSSMGCVTWIIIGFLILLVLAL